YVACVAVIAAFTWAEVDGSRALVVRAVVVAILVAGPATAVGLWRAHGATFAWLTRVPEAVRAGVRLGTGTAALALATASAAALVWAFVGRHTIADGASDLGADAVG